MKLYNCIILLVSSTTCSSAFCHDGNVSVTGTITESSCTISQDSENISVNMGDVSASNFTTVGGTSSPRNFAIHLEHCDSNVSNANVTFSGVSNEVNPDILKITSELNSASGIGIAILNDKKQIVPIGERSTEYPIDISQEDNVLNFYAEYMSTGESLHPGIANSTATFQINYD